MARFVFESFGPLIAFISLEHTVSLLAAIIASIAIGAILVAVQIKRDKKLSPFTAFIAASVVGFGILDLKYQTGFFVKLEPALGNALTGLFFVGTVVMGRPLLVELAEKQMGRSLDNARGYLQLWTLLWGLFFFARSAAYLWMAYNVSLDRALVVRGLLGPLSIGVMIGSEWGVRYFRFGKKAMKRGWSADAPTPAESSAVVEG